MPLTKADRKLINDLLSGCESAWAGFVNRFAGLIIQVIRHTAHAHSLRLSPDDEDDLCSDTFAALLDRRMSVIRNFRGRSSFATYLAVVVRRIVVRKMTRRRYSEALGHVSAHKAAVETANEDGRSAAITNRDEVRSLMQRISGPAREAVRLFYLEGRSYQEVADRLGIRLNSVGPLLSRVRKFLSASG